jgi:hypothetical protein
LDKSFRRGHLWRWEDYAAHIKWKAVPTSGRKMEVDNECFLYGTSVSERMVEVNYLLDWYPPQLLASFLEKITRIRELQQSKAQSFCYQHFS